MCLRRGSVPVAASAGCTFRAMTSVSRERAHELAVAYLDTAGDDLAITSVADAGPFWKVSYNSRAYVETGAVRHALAGNHPLLIDKETGDVAADSPLLPIRHPKRLDARTMSNRVERRIARDFRGESQRATVVALVSDLSDTERVQAAVVIVAAGSVDAARDAVELARLDWRDLLVNAGLAESDWPHRIFEEFGPKD